MTVLGLIAANYLIGFGLCLWSVIDTLRKLRWLAKDEEGPENSAAIRKLLNSKWIISMIGLVLLGGGGFFAAAFLISVISGTISKMVKTLRGIPTEIALLREAGRRYGKAKRGHGIKPETEREPDEAVNDWTLREVYAYSRAQTTSHGGTLPD